MGRWQKDKESLSREDILTFIKSGYSIAETAKALDSKPTTVGKALEDMRAREGVYSNAQLLYELGKKEGREEAEAKAVKRDWR